MIIGMMPALEFAASADSYVASIGTQSYTTLQDAIDNASDGETISIQASVEESVTYTGTTGKTVTINGQGYAVTGTYASGDNASCALTVTGGGTRRLENITFTGGTTSGTTVNDHSVGIYADTSFTGTVADIDGNVSAIGGEANVDSGSTVGGNSIGLKNLGTGTVNVTSATGGSSAYSAGCSIGVYNANGTVNVATAKGVPHFAMLLFWQTAPCFSYL